MSLPLASPRSLGFDADRLARIDRFLAERYVDPGLLPCAQLLVARRGELVHRTVLGHASLEKKQRLADDTIFRIYSMTKPVTSVAFMMLVEEGRIAIDDPVAKWIPSWRDQAVYRSGMPGAFVTRPVDAPMRVLDLLRHTSGLTYGFQLRTNVDAAYRALKADAFESENLEAFVDKLGRLPLEFSPGTAWNYSVSTDVVGHLVSVASGMPFDDFVRTRIVQPLGMRDTDFHVPEAKAARFADCYVKSAAGKLEPAPPVDFSKPPRAPSGGGGGSGRPALTAAAIACGFSAGEYDSPLVAGWFKFCNQQIPLGAGGRMGHDEYTHYYYAQALYVLGDEGWAKLFPKDRDGLTWSKYRKNTFDNLVRSQGADGGWTGGMIGPVFITATHLTILQLDNAALPIYQR